ncbi:sucrose phosphorylase [Alteromonas sp. KUL49]|uniref:sucrose phosphorylase n=1 Tax=Alteromonas sp. KUL49 TaxID=2480798 RepID=UPI00102EE138|nr:sucrose phosphorylase [Alteromonas sp. KUL49]TAP42369.1 sucrose phosphorylase [Alteromonas sp. KUL49]GEA09986.1 sucrose phosphorylase [Alteromonas sp. KUL49]
MSVRNGVQLITYADRLGEGTISGLNTLLNQQFQGLFTGVHILPFYYPFDGEDAGFDPIDHTAVDSRLGNWEDVKQMGSSVNIMADLIVNHMSAQSDEFQDVLSRGTHSEYWPLFLTKGSIFNEDNASDIDKVFRPRPTPCFSDYTVGDNETVPFWTTFTSNQIDIDVESDLGQRYLTSILKAFTTSNIDLIRLDAAGYAIKRAGSSCFMLEETFAFIEDLSDRARKMDMQCLVEIHSHYETQIAIAERCDSVYDFALPPLVLHTLFSKNADALAHWLSISPRNCFTVLDTHDGIGIVDVGPSGDKAGLLTESQIDALVEGIHKNSKEQSKQATGAAASNVDLYQINCTYYDALGQDDYQYLLARAIQFFSPGIPQVYYGGFLAATNDMDLLAKTNVGRDINRPHLNTDYIERAMEKPVVKALVKLIKLRNQSPAFDGEFSVSLNEGYLTLRWEQGEETAQLTVNMANLEAYIDIEKNSVRSNISLSHLLSA